MFAEEIRAYCNNLSGVSEDLKWGHHLVFSVCDKMFLVLGIDEVPVTASFKVSDEEFIKLSDQSGFKPAPYLARYKWIWTSDIANLSTNNWQHTIDNAYTIVASKLPAKKKLKIGFK